MNKILQITVILTRFPFPFPFWEFFDVSWAWNSNLFNFGTLGSMSLKTLRLDIVNFLSSIETFYDCEYLDLKIPDNKCFNFAQRDVS